MSTTDSPNVLSGPPDRYGAETRVGRGRRFFGSRSGLATLVIAVALAVVVALIVMTLRGGGGDDSASDVQTSSVDSGDVTATVSANGNIASGQTMNVDFQGTGGVVTAVLVEPGDRVRKGQALARVDATSARQALRQAEVQLASARAGYLTTTQGQTSQEQARDAGSIEQAQVTVSTAQTSLDAAQASLDLAQRQQNAAVRRAEATVATATESLDAARSRYRADPTPENRQAVTTAQAAVSTARTGLVSARNTRDSTLLQARQQVDSARGQLASAEASLASARATVAVNEQAPREGAVQSAQAQVDNALVGVAQARTTLRQTVLRAPAAGTVVAVSGTVGEPSTSTASSDASATSTSTTEATGFVTLTAANALQVTADVAEADIAEVEVGQPATVTLSATGKDVDGTVTAVDAIETITNNVVEYGVTVTLSDSNGVKLGQSTQVVITTGEKQGVVRVSSSALTTVGSRTTATVQQTDGSTRSVDVVTGLEGDGFTEVLSGLSPGDTVVLPETTDSPTGFTFPGGGLGGLQ